MQIRYSNIIHIHSRISKNNLYINSGVISLENVIYFFSGTGNSYKVAKDIAERMKDTAVINIADVQNAANVDIPYERIGLVFPVYYGGLPPIVREFIKKLRFGRSPYVFGVITRGGASGKAMDELALTVAANGGRLSAGYTVQMPGNYIAMYGAFPKFIRQNWLKNAGKKAVKIGDAAAERVSNRPDSEHLSDITPLTEKLKNYASFAAGYHVNEKCNGCGTCEKVCPVKNIKLENGKPIFGAHCERCMACIQWCPTEAIEYLDKTAKRKHYRHPEVKASELFRKK
jgi:ferredoxin/flavodoxin